jgi:hypothetical protein
MEGAWTMKTLALIAAAALAAGAPALAQQTVTSQRVLPNGDVRTSTTVHDGMGMNGGMDHRMSERMDGRDRTIVSERMVNDGGRGWHRHHSARRVCVTRMHGHRQVRRCWVRHS